MRQDPVKLGMVFVIATAIFAGMVADSNIEGLGCVVRKFFGARNDTYCSHLIHRMLPPEPVRQTEAESQFVAIALGDPASAQVAKVQHYDEYFRDAGLDMRALADSAPEITPYVPPTRTDPRAGLMQNALNSSHLLSSDMEVGPTTQRSLLDSEISSVLTTRQAGALDSNWYPSLSSALNSRLGSIGGSELSGLGK